MWKIKFDNEGKTVERFNNKATVVTIDAEVLADDLLHTIPYQYQVIGEKENTGNIIANVAHEAIYITAKGKAVRSDKDKDNPVLGEKLAECKAKMRKNIAYNEENNCNFCFPRDTYVYGYRISLFGKSKFDEQIALSETVLTYKGKLYKDEMKLLYECLRNSSSVKRIFRKLL